MAFYIKGKVAIVTGGASGIGLSCIKELLRTGLKGVTIADYNETKGQEAVKQLNEQFGENKAFFMKTDVTKADDFEALFKKALEMFESIDIVINNAGIMNDARWDSEIAINCGAVVQGSLLAFQYMGKDRGGKGGILINISSFLGLYPLSSCPVHSATKHFVIGLSRSLGMPYHYSRSAVRVLTLCPGMTTTAHLQEASQNALTTLSRDIGERLAMELKELATQAPDTVAEALIYVIDKGDNGSVWVVEGSKPLYEVVRTFRPA